MFYAPLTNKIFMLGRFLNLHAFLRYKAMMMKAMSVTEQIMHFYTL